MTAPDVMDVNETASYLRISRASVYRLVKSGSLKVTKIGKRTLFSRADIERLLEDARAPRP